MAYDRVPQVGSSVVGGPGSGLCSPCDIVRMMWTNQIRPLGCLYSEDLIKKGNHSGGLIG